MLVKIKPSALYDKRYSVHFESDNAKARIFVLNSYFTWNIPLTKNPCFPGDIQPCIKRNLLVVQMRPSHGMVTSVASHEALKNIMFYT